MLRKILLIFSAWKRLLHVATVIWSWETVCGTKELGSGLMLLGNHMLHVVVWWFYCRGWGKCFFCVHILGLWISRAAVSILLVGGVSCCLSSQLPGGSGGDQEPGTWDMCSSPLRVAGKTGPSPEQGIRGPWGLSQLTQEQPHLHLPSCL